jgi:hypothetical protein
MAEQSFIGETLRRILEATANTATAGMPVLQTAKTLRELRKNPAETLQRAKQMGSDAVSSLTKKTANVGLAYNPALMGLPMAEEAMYRLQNSRPSDEALRNTPKLQADPNRDILTTTTVQDAAGNSYFLPEGADTLPPIAGRQTDVTRQDVAYDMTQRELDAMPSRLAEIKAAKAAAKAAAAAPAAEGEFADSYEDYTNPIDSSLNTPKRSMGAAESNDYSNAILDFAKPMKTPRGEGFDKGGALKRGMEEMGSKPKGQYDEALLNNLFKVATHSTYYGKNKGDAAMMGKITDLLDEYGGELPKGMTPTKFALQLYRRL